MKTKLDDFEQSIENNAEQFVPLSDAEKDEVESIINAANKTKNINIRISAHDIEKVSRMFSSGIGHLDHPALMQFSGHRNSPIPHPGGIG